MGWWNREIVSVSYQDRDAEREEGTYRVRNKADGPNRQIDMEADMVLKVFKDRQGVEGWMYIGDVASLHVDISGWGITHSLPQVEGDRGVYQICGVKPGDGFTIVPDRDVGMVDYHLLFDPEREIQEVPSREENIPDGIRHIKVITVTHADESIELFVVSEDRVAWLLSDSGKTIDRL